MFRFNGEIISYQMSDEKFKSLDLPSRKIEQFKGKCVDLLNKLKNDSSFQAALYLNKVNPKRYYWTDLDTFRYLLDKKCPYNTPIYSFKIKDLK